MDSNISHDEFILVNSVLKEYEDIPKVKNQRMKTQKKKE